MIPPNVGPFEEPGEGVAKSYVNLDALIPRENFEVLDPGFPTGQQDTQISIHHLNSNAFFVAQLRKPDFQRETANWEPQKILDLVRAFADSELIPAIILWKGGRYNFVIDGAHRLSAILAWIYDDYGDGRRSQAYFGPDIPKEQREIAKKTRALVEVEVGAFSKYEKALQKPYDAPEDIQHRVSNLSSYAMTAQWVRTSDARVAEESFFKINESATPIDNVEKRILRSRDSALAIASRSIARSGTGHKYWSQFSEPVAKQIETVSRAIFADLYEPPLEEGPVKTNDVPIAGRGYHQLPFVYDLINFTNGTKAPDSSAKSSSKEPKLPPDLDGQETLAHLRNAQEVLSWIVGVQPRSLGLHPLVYFYNQGGDFRTTPFFGTLDFVRSLIAKDELKTFKSARGVFEDYLIAHKEDVPRLPHKFGSGNRSISWIAKYLQFVYDAAVAGKQGDEIRDAFAKDEIFAFLVDDRRGAERFSEKKGGKDFGRTTKSAAYIRPQLAAGQRCYLCRGLLHQKSIQIHHLKERRSGGGGDANNAVPTHPYCNSSEP